MSDLYHGELPVDMTPAEAREAVERIERINLEQVQRHRDAIPSHPLASGTISGPSHPFTPDVLAWARGEVDKAGEEDWMYGSFVPAHVKAARQILAAVGRV